MFRHILPLSCMLSAVLGQIPTYAGYSLVWGDDFNGPSGSKANPDNWVYATPAANANAGEVQQYTTSTNNARLSGDGALWITPVKDSSGHWTSARLEGKRDFTSEVGHKLIVEAQIRMGDNPPADEQGLWPAFWALGSSNRANPSIPWPKCGEWDIFEAKDGESVAYGTLHCDVNPGGRCNEPVGLSTHLPYSTTGLHTWRLIFDRTDSVYADWPKQTISWWLDGKMYQQVTGAEIGDLDTWVDVARSPFYIIANVAVGGAFPGEPNSATEGGYDSGMFIHYVAVYLSD